MKSKNIDILNKFLEKKLTDIEKVEFKTLYENNQEFCNEVKIHLNMIASIKAADRININTEKSKLLRISRTWLGIAATLAFFVVLTGILLITNKPFSNDKIFTENYSPLKGIETTLGETDAEILTTISFDFYSSNDFENAVKFFEKLDDSLETYMIFTGICYLELNKFAEAEIIFNKVAASESIFINDANWYLALTYLKLKDEEKAIDKLEEISKSTSQYSGKAKEILEELK
jgi:tetratricopeptide (TPR) repeat protein